MAEDFKNRRITRPSQHAAFFYCLSFSSSSSNVEMFLWFWSSIHSWTERHCVLSAAQATFTTYLYHHNVHSLIQFYVLFFVSALSPKMHRSCNDRWYSIKLCIFIIKLLLFTIFILMLMKEKKTWNANTNVWEFIVCGIKMILFHLDGVFPSDKISIARDSLAILGDTQSMRIWFHKGLKISIATAMINACVQHTRLNIPNSLG